MKNLKTVIKTSNNIDSILFPVEKMTMSEATNGLLVGGTSETEYGVVGLIDDKKQLLNACSSRYNLTPNVEIFAPIEAELLGRGMDFDVTYRNINNVKFYGDFVIKHESLNVGIGEDVIFPKINIAHSYNGMLNYTVNMGYFRLICSNGLTVPVVGQEQHNFSVKGKHTPKMTDSLDTLMEKIDFLLTQKSLAKKGFEKLFNTKVTNLDEMLVSTMESIKMNAKNGKSGKLTKNFEFAKSIAQKEMAKLDSDMNMWLVYNAVNNTIFNDDLNTKHNEFRMEDDKKLMTNILEMV